MASETERQELIRQRAYDIWEKEGRPGGQHDRHWQQASAEIEASLGKKAPAKKSAPAKKAKTAAAAKAAPTETAKETPGDGAAKARPRRKAASS